MSKNRILLLFFSLYTTLLFSSAPNLPDAETVIYLNIDNKQEATNSIQLNKEPKKKVIRCSTISGDKLKECVISLTKAKQKKILLKFSKQHRSAFFRTFDGEGYENFLETFTDAEWKFLVAKLSESEKKQWPKTIKEQKDKIAAIKKAVDEEHSAAQTAIKAAFWSITTSIVITPVLSGLVGYLEIINHRKKVFEAEEQGIKKYIEEKFG